MFTARLIAILFSVLCTWSSVAHAQSDGHARMMVLNDEGVAAFKSGEFVAAALSFRAAFREVADPSLKHNEAIAWYKARDWKNAIDAGNLFLLQEGNSEADQTATVKLIASSKLELAKEALDAGDFELAAAFLDDVDASNPDSYIADQAKFIRLDIAKAQSGEPARRGPSVAGPVVTSLGVAVLGSAIIYHAVMLGAQREFVGISDGTRTGDRARHDKLRQRVNVARWLSPSLYVFGGVATGVGIFLWVRPRRESEDGTLGVGLTRRF